MGRASNSATLNDSKLTHRSLHRTAKTKEGFRKFKLLWRLAVVCTLARLIRRNNPSHPLHCLADKLDVCVTSHITLKQCLSGATDAVSVLIEYGGASDTSQTLHLNNGTEVTSAVCREIKTNFI